MTEALRTFALAATIVALHLILLALWTGTVRVFKKAYVNPEDAKLNKADQVEADHPDVQRAKRAHQNALENAVPFFLIGFLFASTGPSKQAQLIYFGTFVAARILHSIFYLWGKQPFRTLMFVIGVLATIGMGVQVILKSI
jgi:uncharacterized MAPEG superfamily protein